MRKLLKKSNIPSPLLNGSRIKPTGSKARRSIAATITLTSLIDAFVIIVIYLVVCSSPSENTIDIQDNITLPQAKNTHDLDGAPVIVFKDNRFLIEDNPVDGKFLKEHLQNLVAKTKQVFKGKDSAIIIQADEKVGFDKLQPLLVASAHAGIKHVKFAVLQEE